MENVKDNSMPEKEIVHMPKHIEETITEILKIINPRFYLNKQSNKLVETSRVKQLEVIYPEITKILKDKFPKILIDKYDYKGFVLPSTKDRKKGEKLVDEIHKTNDKLRSLYEKLDKDVYQKCFEIWYTEG